MAARINGPHACGHPSRYLSDSQAARDMVAQWATEDCGHCVKLARDMAAAAMARDLGLPAIVNGSDKQVAYAQSVREEARQMLAEYMDKHQTAEDMAATEAMLYGITDATWWIARHRSGSWYAAGLVEWVRPLVTIALSYKGA